jgi:hypothetical protein
LDIAPPEVFSLGLSVGEVQTQVNLTFGLLIDLGLDELCQVS